ncbi:hypothetical protein FGB62_1g243 [Gracilaria domingensis]|nr:hypothetical protein FGB62_1g243 [Gracilaria domingensis]
MLCRSLATKLHENIAGAKRGKLRFEERANRGEAKYGGDGVKGRGCVGGIRQGGEQEETDARRDSTEGTESWEERPSWNGRVVKAQRTRRRGWAEVEGLGGGGDKWDCRLNTEKRFWHNEAKAAVSEERECAAEATSQRNQSGVIGTPCARGLRTRVASHVWTRGSSRPFSAVRCCDRPLSRCKSRTSPYPNFGFRRLPPPQKNPPFARARRNSLEPCTPAAAPVAVSNK